MEQRDDRLPLPSEDEGDLVNEPPTGMTDNYLVAQEEGVPYDPPSDRVMSDTRASEGGPDVAGIDPTDAGELERDDMIQPPDGQRPTHDELQADVVEDRKLGLVARLRRTGAVGEDDVNRALGAFTRPWQWME